MKWTIIILVVMSLLGSMMWVMPSPRQRFLAKLRQQASRHGFQVQMVHLISPRAAGEIEPETRMATVYRLPRYNLDKQQRYHFKVWQVFRQTAVANEGLPEGWCWGKGERCLNAQQLITLNTLLEALPEGVSSIESTPVHLSIFWDERGDENMLDEFQTLLKPILDQQF